MTLTKTTSVDQITVTENGTVICRKATRIMEDGKHISNTFHRYLVYPGYDYSAEDARVQAICAATHTAGVIAAYKAAIAAQGV